MNHLPEPNPPTDAEVPGTAFADRVIGGSKGYANRQAAALLNALRYQGVEITQALEDAITAVAAGDDSRITGAAQKSANLSDLTNAETARSNLGLGSAATRDVGTGANEVPTNDDLGSAATRNVTTSTDDPSGGVDGDIWFKVE